MRKLYVLAVVVLLAGCNGQVKDSEKDHWTEAAALVGNYGAEIDAKGAISTAELMKLMAESDSVTAKVEGEITATCAMKGCWMNLLLDDGQEMRVTFKDYAFFVPSEGMEGNRAIIEGVVVRTITDVETLKHYASDAGKPQIEIDAITEDKEELAFEASGVIIYSDSEEVTDTE